MLERQQQAMIFGLGRVNAMWFLDITAGEQTDNVSPMNYEPERKLNIYIVKRKSSRSPVKIQNPKSKI